MTLTATKHNPTCNGHKSKVDELLRMGSIGHSKSLYSVMGKRETFNWRLSVDSS